MDDETNHGCGGIFLGLETVAAFLCIESKNSYFRDKHFHGM